MDSYLNSSLYWYDRYVLLINERILYQIYYDKNLFFLNFFLYFLFCFLTFLFFIEFLLLIFYLIFAIKGCYDVQIRF